MHAFRDEVEAAKVTWGKKLARFDARVITERDILSMALLGPGPSEAATKKPNGQLSYAFLKNIGIHKRIAEDIPLTVQYLAHRQRTTQAHQKSRNSPSSLATAKTGASIGAQKERDENRNSNNKKREIQQLKAILRQSDPDSIQRILYPLLNNNYGRSLVAECPDEIIQGMVGRATTSPKVTRKATKDIRGGAEDTSRSQGEGGDNGDEEATTRATIFLKNLTYNLTKNGNLPAAHLTSTWSKVLEMRPANEQPRPLSNQYREGTDSAVRPQEETNTAPTTDTATLSELVGISVTSDKTRTATHDRVSSRVEKQANPGRGL